MLTTEGVRPVDAEVMYFPAMTMVAFYLAEEFAARMGFQIFLFGWQHLPLAQQALGNYYVAAEQPNSQNKHNT
ncbi:MAG: hypothetical protein ACRC8E_06030 [Plesiomonas shigelloides]